MSETGLDDRPVAVRIVRSRMRIDIRPLVVEALAVFFLIALVLAIVAPAIAKLATSDWRFVAITLFVYAAVSAIAISGLRAHPHRRLGLANIITSVRAGLTALIAASLIETGRLGPGGDETLTWVLTAIVVVALALDGIDGFAARRAGTQSDFGKRFDMEIDALLVLMLSLMAFASGKAGLFVILLGTMRYAYLAIHAMFPRLPKELDPSFARKTVCVLQVAALCLIMTPVVAPPLSDVIALVSLVLLAMSFGRDLSTQISRYARIKPGAA